jgi:integrase
MSRPRTIVSNLHHRQSGRARAVWTEAAGVRREKLLPGRFGSAASRKAHVKLQLELTSSPSWGVRPDLTIAELLCAYLAFAESHYVDPDGKPTSELCMVKIVLRALRELYGKEIAVEFGPLRLKAARQKWVNEGRTRTECNRRVGMVKRIFRWATSEELVPPSVYHGLTSVSGLQRGRTEAPETKPVRPVDDIVVEATLPFVPRHVQGLIEFQRLTGCRPGEACAVRRCDLDTGGATWFYRPPQHKNSWRGKDRVIAIGPQAQSLFRSFFVPDLAAYLFTPKDVPNAPKSRKPGWQPGEMMGRTSYTRAVARGVDKANSAAMEDVKKVGQGVVAKFSPIPHWHPNQLRHTFATRVRKQFGLEAAQVALGHSRCDVSEIYAEKNHALAAAVVAKIG